eukprot:scaffold47663_cov270-Isochrysis_galbana.AAC.1
MLASCSQLATCGMRQRRGVHNEWLHLRRIGDPGVRPCGRCALCCVPRVVGLVARANSGGIEERTLKRQQCEPMLAKARAIKETLMSMSRVVMAPVKHREAGLGLSDCDEVLAAGWQPSARRDAALCPAIS